MKQYQYGLDVNRLGEFISVPIAEKSGSGFYTLIIDLPEYRLECVVLKKGKTFSFTTPREFETTVYVEEGKVQVKGTTLKARGTMTVPPRSVIEIEAVADATVYFFSGPADDEGTYYKARMTVDHRDKYWGEIETIIGKSGYSGKRMLVKKGKYASLEFHCKKFESYYVHSGSLLLRLRAGRGEDRFFDIPEGRVLVTPPGLMHQRGGIEDTVIIEISTKDEDSDSFLVEDGAKHKMPRLESYIHGEGKKGGKRIGFDIDGVLCTQTDGDYSKAQPVKEAVECVNRLYDEGYTIFVYTARFMTRNKYDQQRVYEEGYAFTKNQLESWGVKFHELFLGKPPFDAFIDDRAIFFKPDFDLIEKEIRAKLRENI